jgi:hypothetical protein
VESKVYSEQYISRLVRSILRFIAQCHAKVGGGGGGAGLGGWDAGGDRKGPMGTGGGWEGGAVSLGGLRRAMRRCVGGGGG